MANYEFGVAFQTLKRLAPRIFESGPKDKTMRCGSLVWRQFLKETEGCRRPEDGPDLHIVLPEGRLALVEEQTLGTSTVVVGCAIPRGESLAFDWSVASEGTELERK